VPVAGRSAHEPEDKRNRAIKPAAAAAGVGWATPYTGRRTDISPQIHGGVSPVTVAATAGNSPEVIWTHDAREFDRARSTPALPPADALQTPRDEQMPPECCGLSGRRVLGRASALQYTYSLVMGTLRLSRPARLLVDRWHRYTIMIDHERVGSIADGETVEIPVEAGIHILKVANVFVATLSSGDAAFTLDDGEAVEFVVRARIPGFEPFPWFHRDQWLELKRA